MRKRIQIVLLCEDRQQRTFLLRFLRKARPSDQLLRVEMCPKTSGSAEQYVRDRFPRELAGQRSSNVARALIVMLDGDRRGVQGRMAEIDNACRNANTDVRGPNEKVLVLVPTWRIETWLAYLDGETVDETRRDYPRLARPRDCDPHLDVLVEMCRKNRLRQPAPASLTAACAEYRNRL